MIEENIIQSVPDDYPTERQVEVNTTVSDLLARREITLENGELLSYYAGGSGEQTIVIVNAYGQGLTYWTKIIANLLDTYRIIVWLPRGNGFDTVGVSRYYPVTGHREDLKRVVANERVEKCVFLGWCTGPKLILDYYSRHPDDIASMIFLGATFKNLPGQAQLDTEYERGLDPLFKLVHDRPQLAGRFKESLQLVLLAGKANPDSAAEVMQMPGSPCSDLKEAVIEPYLTDEGVVNYARQILDFWNHDASELFAGVRVPVLFITGEYDRIASTGMAQTAAQLIPGARYMEIKGGSHYLQYEESSLTARIIKLFLRLKSTNALGVITSEYLHV